VVITNNVYTPGPVEPRQYADYMYYGPLPYNDVVKESLVQNKGW